jgi:hypothetical protein
MQDLFSAALLKQSGVGRFNYCASVIALGDGKGHFKVNPLPLMTQLSSVNAIWMGDVDNDGNKDMLLGGNMFGFPPQFGRLDASYGHLLRGDGKGNFSWTEPRMSGLNIRGEIRDIQSIKLQKPAILILQNDHKPELYRFSR